MRLQFKYDTGKILNVEIPITAQEVLFEAWEDFREKLLTIDTIEPMEMKTESDFETPEEYKAWAFEYEEYAKRGMQLVNEAVRILIKDPAIDEFPYTVGEDESIDTIIGIYKHLSGLADRWTEMGFLDPRVEIIVEPINGNTKQKIKKMFLGIANTPGIYFIAKDGQIYGLPKHRIEKIAGQKNLESGEIIEMLEIQRLGQKALEDMKEPGQNSTIDFTMGLSHAAVLLRKPGERLPFNKGEREAFIAQRIEVMKQLPLSVILNVRSFFLISLIQFANRRIAGGLSKVSKPLTLVRPSTALGRR